MKYKILISLTIITFTTFTNAENSPPTINHPTFNPDRAINAGGFTLHFETLKINKNKTQSIVLTSGKEFLINYSMNCVTERSSVDSIYRNNKLMDGTGNPNWQYAYKGGESNLYRYVYAVLCSPLTQETVKNQVDSSTE